MAVFSKLSNFFLLTTASVCFATTITLIYILRNQSAEELYDDFEAIKSSRHTVIEVPIPASAIGAVIGRSGTHIAKIQEATSTRINFRDQVKGSSTRVAIIRGKPNDAQAAERLIRTAAAERMTITSAEMQIPLKACGYVIGKSGTNIRSIKDMSNARLTLDSYGTGDLRLMTITGTPKEIEIAKALVEEMVTKALQPRKDGHELSTANRLINYQNKKLCNTAEQPPIDKKWETIELTPSGQDQFLEIFISSVTSPSQFWVQPVGLKANELDKLVEAMTDYYGYPENVDEEYHSKEVKESDFLAAPFECDSSWYRVSVISVIEDDYNMENNSIRVFYLDFGDFATFKKQDLYFLKEEFKNLEFQAVECKLYNAIPKESSCWSDDAIKCFEELTHCAQWKGVMLKIVGEEKSMSTTSTIKCVQLVDTQGKTDIDVAHVLVERGFAIRQIAESQDARNTTDI